MHFIASDKFTQTTMHLHLLVESVGDSPDVSCLLPTAGDILFQRHRIIIYIHSIIYIHIYYNHTVIYFILWKIER